MAKVAAPGSLPPASIQIGGSVVKPGPMFKRKTPSELRGEQLKRNNVVELVDKSSNPLPGSTNKTSEVDNGSKKSDLFRNPRYIGTRMDEVYPAKKSRVRTFFAKENAKENVSTEQLTSLKNLSVLSSLTAKRQQLSCSKNSVASAEVLNEGKAQTRETLEKCSQSIFRSVTEISSGGEKLFGSSIVDMDKALKGLVVHEIQGSGLTTDSSEKFGQQILSYSGNFCSEFHTPGQKVPLDFTLKTKMRVACSCSVNWIHRSIMASTYNGLPQVTSQFDCTEINRSAVKALACQIVGSKALHSWIYPQSTLPPSVISALISSAVDGGEIDFLQKRYLAWEDSLRSLYYMFRNNICNIFYVCTTHFVVMFINSFGSGRSDYLCNAYISQSTRALRSSLKEHDVCFSMPLCHSKVEQVTKEDLVELSEIEKQNLGQTRRLSSMYDVDNSPQSLLAFCGTKNVHGLYDFLLNYRSFLTSTQTMDVPVIYSPVPFQNAALSAPEIRCMEIKRPDQNAASPKESTGKDGETVHGSSTGLCSSIEIKDAYIPAWIISRVCALIGSEGRSFEASFTTERTSVGLNVAVEAVCEKPDSKVGAGENLQESIHDFAIPETIVSPCLRSGFLKGLKYNDSSYTASLSPV